MADPWFSERMPDVVILGAGVLGAATAHALAEAGCHVEVLEAAQVGGGASASSFAVDISRVKTPRVLFDLGLQSAAEHTALAQTVGRSTWRHPIASLEWEHSGDGQRRIAERVGRLQGWGYPADFVSPEAAHRIESALALPTPELQEIAFYPQGAWYEADRFVAALIDRARACGASVHANDPVTAIKTASGQISAVVTGTGRRVSADAFVNCGGPQAQALAALAGARLPLRQVPGLIVTSTPATPGLRTIVHADDLNLRPDGAGRVVLHSWVTDGSLGPGPQWPERHGLAERLLDRARRLVPGLCSSAVESARVGVRPVPLDGQPIVGWLPELENLYGVVSHSAVHLAPILGRLAAAELTGTVEPRLTPFRPGRFAADAAVTEPLDESSRVMLAQIAAASQEPDGAH